MDHIFTLQYCGGPAYGLWGFSNIIY